MADPGLFQILPDIVAMLPEVVSGVEWLRQTAI